VASKNIYNKKNSYPKLSKSESPLSKSPNIEVKLRPKKLGSKSLEEEKNGSLAKGSKFEERDSPRLPFIYLQMQAKKTLGSKMFLFLFFFFLICFVTSPL
jgi:hypothetical protein